MKNFSVILNEIKQTRFLQEIVSLVFSHEFRRNQLPSLIMHEQSAWLLFETLRKVASRYVYGGTWSAPRFCSCRVYLLVAS